MHLPLHSSVQLVAIFIGLLVLYLPTAWDLGNSIWRTDQNSHGPIVLIASLFLVSRKLSSINAMQPRIPDRSTLAGGAIFLIGLLLYVLGRSQGLVAAEVLSLIVVLFGLVTLSFGRATARQLWFPFLIMLFAVPMPGSVVDVMTQPLKILASAGAETLLFTFGYPIARSGVTLAIGQYQLLVADACAGLNSLFTLEALGLLYINLVPASSALRTLALAILIVPISIASNVLRVSLLALITYHYGDAAGQGFMHDFSGIALFLIALALIIAVDGLLRSASQIHLRFRHA